MNSSSRNATRASEPTGGPIGPTGARPHSERDAAYAAARPIKHSFSIAGHRTSISLEADFWDALRQAAQREGVALAELVRRIDGARGDAGLSSAVRVWILGYARTGGLRDDRASGQLASPEAATGPVRQMAGSAVAEEA